MPSWLFGIAITEDHSCRNKLNAEINYCSQLSIMTIMCTKFAFLPSPCVSFYSDLRENFTDWKISFKSVFSCQFKFPKTRPEPVWILALAHKHSSSNVKKLTLKFLSPSACLDCPDNVNILQLVDQLRGDTTVTHHDHPAGPATG